MSQDPNHLIYEVLTQICAEFCQTPYHHQDRLALLDYSPNEWVEVHQFLTPDTRLAQRLQTLVDQDVILSVSYRETPDQKWFLLSFYCSLIDAIPATALLLKAAHKRQVFH